MQAKQGSISCPASTGNFSVTGIGFAPDAVIFFVTPQTAAGYATGANFGMGIATAANQVQYRFTAPTGATSVLGEGGNVTTTGCLITYNSTTFATAVAASRVSLDADGFTLNFTTVTSGTIIHYLAIQGVFGAYVGTTTYSSAGNVSTTGVGFTPDAVLAVTMPGTSAAALSIGAATSPSSRAATFWGTVNLVSANAKQISDRLITTAQADADYVSADLVSMDADGFTVSTSSASSAPTMFLCLKGGILKVGTDTQRTSTGSKSTTGLGQPPKGILFASWNAASSTALQTTGSIKFSLGSSDATNHGSVWLNHSDGTNPTTTNKRTTTAAALGMSTGPSTTNAEATVASFDGDGFTLNWSTADATAREFIYFSIGGLPPDPIGKLIGVRQGMALGGAIARAANW